MPCKVGGLERAASACTGNDARAFVLDADQLDPAARSADPAVAREGIALYGLRAGSARRRIGGHRLAKAEQLAVAANFVLELADEADEVGDTFVTLAMHPGVATAEAICVARLRQYSRGESHQDAVALPGEADSARAKPLERLLQLKAKAATHPGRCQHGTRLGVPW